MKKFIILIPVFNDWESLKKLLNEINENLKKVKNVIIDCIVVNDASTISSPNLSKPSNINSLKVMNMKKNKGHARCNAFGIRYVNENENFNNLILMDGDGEDRPVEINSLIEQALKNENYSIVAKRIKRSEGKIFQLLYNFHKLITLIFAGQKIKFGNYSCLTKKDVKILSSKKSLWSSFSGTVKKNIKSLKEIDSIRGIRYFGPSKMSLFKLLIHSFSIIAVFKYQVLFRSLIILILINVLESNIGLISVIIQFLVIIFNIAIFIVSLRENKNQFLNSHKNLDSVRVHTHTN